MARALSGPRGTRVGSVTAAESGDVAQDTQARRPSYEQARDELARDPIIGWNLGAASVALFGLILAVNLVGDGVRDAFDPRGDLYA